MSSVCHNFNLIKFVTQLFHHKNTWLSCVGMFTIHGGVTNICNNKSGVITQILKIQQSQIFLCWCHERILQDIKNILFLLLFYPSQQIKIFVWIINMKPCVLYIVKSYEDTIIFYLGNSGKIYVFTQIVKCWQVCALENEQT